jgi:hypothetical protein
MVPVVTAELAMGVQVLAWIGYTVACVLIGGTVLRAFRIRPSEPVDGWALAWLCTAYALAQSLLGTVLQMLALAGQFKPWVLLIVMVAASIPGWRTARTAVGELIAAGRSEARAVCEDAWPWRVLVACTGLLVAVFLVLAWHPPGGDALAYYFVLPKLVAASGQFFHVPGYTSFSQIGLAAEMNFAALMALGGELSAKLAIWGTALAGTGILCAIAADVGIQRRGRWIVFASAWTSSAYTLLAWDGKTDQFPTLLALAAVYWVLRGRDPSLARAVPVAGLLTGFAMVGKLSFIPIMFALLGTLLLGQALREVPRPWRAPGQAAWQLLRKGVPLAAWTLVGLASLALKNAFVYGEPLAPFVMFGDQPGIDLSQVWYSPEDTRWIVLTYPLALVFGRYPMQYGNVANLWLAALPFALLLPRTLWREYRELLWLSLAGALAIATWVILRPSVLAPRYFLPAILTLYPLAGLLVEGVWRRQGLWLVRAALPLLLILTILQNCVLHVGPLSRALNIPIPGPEEFKPHLWNSLRTINERAALGDRVLVGSYYSYPLRADLIQCALPLSDVHRVLNQDGAPSWALVRQMGVRFIALDASVQSVPGGWTTDPDALPAWLHVEEIYVGTGWRALELHVGDGAPPAERNCRQVDGTWTIVTAPH